MDKVSYVNVNSVVILCIPVVCYSYNIVDLLLDIINIGQKINVLMLVVLKER